METAIRWSPLSSASDARLLLADVIGRTFRLCKVTEYKNKQLRWDEISRNTNVPAFRAFDWAAHHGIVAVGEWSGLVTLLGLDSTSESLHIPIKSPRQCNAVAFNIDSLLATGLERIRNDFCLNVYDVGSWTPHQPHKSRLSTERTSLEPVRRLATSEGITSIKFFPGRPDTLVCGVKGTCVRTYDLRERDSNPSLQYQTGCVHNLAVDPCDENYFASAGPSKDATVFVWDRRSSARSLSSPSPSTSTTQDGPVLEFNNIFGSSIDSGNSSTWSLRFSRTEPGCLAVLASNGHLQLFRTKKDHVAEDKASPEDSKNQYTQPLTLDRIDHVEQGHDLQDSALGPRQESLDRIVSFDFMNLVSPRGRLCAITLRGSQSVGIHEFTGKPPVLASSTLSSLVMSDGIYTGSTTGLQHISAPKDTQIFHSAKRAAHMSRRKQRSSITVGSEGTDDSKQIVGAALADDNTQYKMASAGYNLEPQINEQLRVNDQELRELWYWIKSMLAECSLFVGLTTDSQSSHG